MGYETNKNITGGGTILYLKYGNIWNTNHWRVPLSTSCGDHERSSIANPNIPLAWEWTPIPKLVMHITIGYLGVLYISYLYPLVNVYIAIQNQGAIHG